jgi:uncharacterized protein
MMLPDTLSERVAVLGASANPERYAYKAIQLLLDYGHQVFPVSLKGDSVLGQTGYQSILDIACPIDTVTMYISSEKSDLLKEALLRCRPKRVIFNPGAENPALVNTLRDAGIVCQDACTLVLLKTHQWTVAK